MTATIEDFGRVIERRFAELDADAADSFRVLDLPQEANGRPLLLGVGSDGYRLLVPCARDEHRQIRPDRSAAGIHMLVRPLGDSASRAYYLDLVCLRADLVWLFSAFVADTLLRLAHKPEASAIALARSCFSAWRALFRSGSRNLSLKQLAGLYGEVAVLDRLLERTSSAVERWRGPLRAPHDFVGLETDIEVKTTLSSEDRVVHIHGVDQLAEPEAGSLFLAHLRVEVPAQDGITLPELLERVSAKDARGKLPGLLRAAGYFAEHAEAYEGARFKLAAEEWFAVVPGFPRLETGSFPESQIPAGLSDFKYTLDLSAVPQPSITPQEIDAVLDRVAA